MSTGNVFSSLRFDKLITSLQNEVKYLIDENNQLKQRLAVYESGVVSQIQNVMNDQFHQLPSVLKRASTNSNQQPFYSLNGHSDGVWDVNCARWDSKMLVSASSDGKAIVWRASNDEKEQIIAVYQKHNGSVNAAKFHPTLPYVCTASGDRSIHVFKVPSESTSNEYINPPVLQRKRSYSWPSVQLDSEIHVNSIDKSNSKNKHLNYYQANDDSNDNIWNINQQVDNSSVEIIGAHAGPVVSVDWFYGGKEIASGSWDSKIRVFNIDVSSSASQEIVKFEGHTDRISNITTHSSLPMLLSSSLDGTFRMWDLRTSKSLLTIEAHDSIITTSPVPVNTALFSPNGEVIATSGDDKTINIWDIRKTKSPFIEISVPSNANRLSFSPSGTYLSAPLDNGVTLVYDTRGELLAQLYTIDDTKKKKSMATACSWTCDEHAFFTSSWEVTLLGWVNPCC